METQDTIKLIVDEADATPTGWVCSCIHPNETEYLERCVSADELLAALHADNKGFIP